MQMLVVLKYNIFIYLSIQRYCASFQADFIMQSGGASIYNCNSLTKMTQLIKVQWKRKIQTDTVLQDIFDNLTEDSVRAYQKCIGQIWEILEVTRGAFTWRVYKSHEEIQDFILVYNLQFKSKLVFDLFLVEGLRRVCQNPEVQKWPPFLAFVQVEDSEMGKIGSFVLLKKSGGRFKDYFCCRLPWQWQKRNFVIIKAGILYYAQSTKQIKEYLPFGNSFKILCGRKETGYEFGIKLQANHRKLLLFTSDCRIFCKFVYQVKETNKQVEGPQQHPYESFAPTRLIQQIQFLIDGEKYFEAVYEALERAQWQIMICGWMVSPQFQLKRPVDKFPNARFDTILEKAAKNGVKIFILVYNQSSFLTNDSAYTKETLQKLSSNIKVLQHPLGVLPTFWSHHQKAVIIDQNEVLMGGLDLCYGRFDTSQHRVSHNDPQWYPGIEYNNIRTKDLVNVREFWKQSVARDVARLPWHDVGVHFSGEVTQDVCHHFIEYWNYASFQTHYEGRYLLILQKDRPKQPLIKRIKKGISNKIDSIRHLADEIKQKLFSNAKKEQKETQVKVSEPSPIEIRSDDIKIEIEPKMILELQSDSNGKLMHDRKKVRQSANSLPSRETQLDSNRTYRSNRSNDFKEQMLAYQSQTTQNTFKHQKTKKTVSELDQIVENMQDQIEKIDYINDIRITNTTRMAIIPEEEQQPVGFSCQILRSVGSWSIGCSPQLREQSIHNAYLSLINSAKHFIYIENQFFVSAIEGSFVIKNQIAYAIYDRIIRAHLEKEAFKVYVVLPLIPGFAGQLDDPQAVIPRVIMHWQYHTIARGESSLLGKLRKAGVNPDDFIVFLSLRAHGVIEGIKKQPTTEIVYLHTKLMIVDDKIAIIGSANINDRSMRGSRDSELCLLVQGRPTVKTFFNNQPIYVDNTIRNLRLDLWKQHFGSDLSYEDPVSMQCLRSIKKRAKQNTMMYREVFHCYPDDQVNKLTKLMDWRMPINEQLYDKCFDEVKGFVVEFPLEFLKDQDLLVGSTLYPDILSI